MLRQTDFVQKFGGSSVRDAERVMNVAQIVTDTYRAGNDVVVVVSAQGDTTDDLIEKAYEINSKPSKREMDMLMASGEQISIALLAMAIEKLGCPAVHFLVGRQDLTQVLHTEQLESRMLRLTDSVLKLTVITLLLWQVSRDLTNMTI